MATISVPRSLNIMLHAAPKLASTLLPLLAAQPGGGYVVAWEDKKSPPLSTTIYARWFDDAGAGPDFIVAEWGTNTNLFEVAMGIDDQFAVTYVQPTLDHYDGGVIATSAVYVQRSTIEAQP